MLVFGVCPNNDGDIDGLQGRYLYVQIAIVTPTVYENATYFVAFCTVCPFCDSESERRCS